jgi:hypothetical protein
MDSPRSLSGMLPLRNLSLWSGMLCFWTSVTVRWPIRRLSLIQFCKELTDGYYVPCPESAPLSSWRPCTILPCYHTLLIINTDTWPCSEDQILGGRHKKPKKGIMGSSDRAAVGTWGFLLETMVSWKAARIQSQARWRQGLDLEWPGYSE